MENVEKQRVSSSTVISIGYDAPTQTLEIEFGSGRVYQYYGVPDHTHAEIMEASSKRPVLQYAHQECVPTLARGVGNGLHAVRGAVVDPGSWLPATGCRAPRAERARRELLPVGDAGAAAGGANHEQAQPLGTHVRLLVLPHWPLNSSSSPRRRRCSAAGGAGLLSLALQQLIGLLHAAHGLLLRCRDIAEDLPDFLRGRRFAASVAFGHSFARSSDGSDRSALRKTSLPHSRIFSRRRSGGRVSPDPRPTARRPGRRAGPAAGRPGAASPGCTGGSAP